MVKLLQLNIWMGKLTWAAARFIEHEQPDIICLQEVFDSDAPVLFPDRLYDCCKIIQQASGLEYSLFSPVFSTDVAGGVAEYGNMILSRYPFTFTETIFTAGEYVEHSSMTNYIDNTRNMQIVETDIDGKKLTLINHHAHWEKTPMGSEASIEKMKIVAERAREVEGPLILSGDLNLQSESPAMRVFDGWLDDLVAHSDVVTTLSKLGQPLDIVCDHIMSNSDITVRKFEVKDDIVSDHKAVMLEFEING